MRNFLTVVMAIVFVFAVSGSEAAYFEDFKLIRTIYDKGSTLEIGSDLGVNPQGFSLAPDSPVNLYVGDLIDSTTLSGLNGQVFISYYAHGQSVQDFWATGGYEDGDGLNMLGRKQGTDIPLNNVQGYYAGLGVGSTVEGDWTNEKSYYYNMDKNGASFASYGGSMDAASLEATVSLAGLTVDDPIDTYLYWFDYDNSTATKTGIEVAVVRTYLDSAGNIGTTINPSAVPVPASVLLLGSGILGVFGIRIGKKKN